jgi:hypothetical protein
VIDAFGIATDIGDADDVDAFGSSSRLRDNKTSGHVDAVGATPVKGSNDVLCRVGTTQEVCWPGKSDSLLCYAR